MTALILHEHPLSPHAQKCKIALKADTIRFSNEFK